MSKTSLRRRQHQIERLDPMQLAVWISAAPDLPQRSALALFYIRRIRLSRNPRSGRTQVNRAFAFPCEGPPATAGVASREVSSNEATYENAIVDAASTLPLNCAPISARQSADRSMRSAISRADGSVEFVSQQNFDRAVAGFVRLIPIPAESASGSPKRPVSAQKWTWKKVMRSPRRPRDQHRRCGHCRRVRV